MNELEFLTLDQVMQIHSRSLSEHGGMEGVREPGLVVYGNKRTAIGAALVFLARNGAYVRQPTWQLYNAMIQIAERKLDKRGLAQLFRRAAQDE